ncbi:MAG TPA: 2-oxoacid:acceptor oxidoreductase subunit alpha [Aggregatilineaceae bacterium]|nr:2-oxoacid:acceptor oxidoreductase subunit alpha [Aggregatilineaceae bacterium]
MTTVQNELDTLMTGQKPIINDFQIMIATPNGSGSQTANTVLLRSIFRMGIPVSGKNIFPSNIQGLPTWYTIRVSKDGYIARLATYHICVAMNRDTASEDIQNLPSGAVCLYPSEWKIPEDRSDIIYYAMPVKELTTVANAPSNLTAYISNMVYVGVLTALLDIDINQIEYALDYHFNGKTKPIQMNFSVVKAGYEWALDNLPKRDPYKLEKMKLTEGMLLMDGNSAGALGAVFGGVGVAAWYPITPSTSLIDSMREYLAEMRTDAETGKATYAVIQAEDEIGAIGMVIGAGWAGARAMTATSGPGMSLMSEYAGLAYYAEVPSVIWNVQRMGPSTGLPTRTSQGDILKAYFLGHGDTKHVCLIPGSIEEIFEFGWRAFDLAERLQTLIFVMIDLDFGMNVWMSKPFQYPDEPMDRGKVLSAEELEQMPDWGRYEDVDGDGIGYRTLPGLEHPRAAWFARGTGHNPKAIYSERVDDWVANMARLNRKFDYARTIVPAPVVDDAVGAAIGLIAYGSSDPCVVEGRDQLRQHGIETDYLRLRALPLSETTRNFIAAHDRVYVVDNNTDGQMAKLLHMEYPELAARIKSLAYSDGLSLTAQWLVDAVTGQEQ